MAFAKAHLRSLIGPAALAAGFVLGVGPPAVAQNVPIRPNAQPVLASPTLAAWKETESTGGLVSAAEPVGPIEAAGDAPDPHINPVGSGGVLLTTQADGMNVPARRSVDLKYWTAPVDALPALPVWAAPGRTWAPASIFWQDRYVLYFAAAHAASGRQCIGVAVSTRPEGPFLPADEPLVCQLELGGSIDPEPFIDRTNSLWLVWKSDENAVRRPSRLWSAKLDGTAAHVDGPYHELLRYSGGWEKPLIENPSLLDENDQLILFYSAGRWQSDTYGVGYARCDGPAGPCVKETVNAPLIESDASVAGPGGLSVFRGPNGRAYAVFHAWDPGITSYAKGGVRRSHVLRLAVPPASAPILNP
jgi:beta-xylosidase